MKAPPPQEAADQATVVFEGVALGMKEMPAEGGRPSLWVEYEFEVKRQWKGPGSDKLSLRTANNSAACGRSFETGKAYVIYAREIDGTLSDNACSRTRPTEQACEDLQAFGETCEGGGAEPPQEPVEPEPPRVEPDPPEQNGTEQPPAPAPSARGCSVGGPAEGLPWLVLVPAWLYSRRRRRS